MNPQFLMALLPTIASLFNPGGSNAQQSSSYSKGQQSLIDQATSAAKGRGVPQGISSNPQYQQANDYLSSLFNDPEFFNKFEAPMQRQFQEQTIPDLISRFASQGSTGGQGSSAFRNQMLREAGNLHTNIAAMRGGMQQQGANQLFNSSQMPMNEYSSMLNSILGHPQMNQYQPATNPMANIAGPMLQMFLQQQGMNQNKPTSAPALQPGQSPLTQ